MTLVARSFGRGWTNRMVRRFAFVMTLIVLQASSAIVASAATVPDVPAERWAKLADTVFENITPINGLPNVGVTALAQDADGFLWVGSQSGVGRWDGYRFHIYANDPQDPASLPHSFVRTFYLDRRNRLWFGTAGGGLARYDRERDRFVRFPIGKDGISHISVRSITGDGADGLWVGTDGGLNHVDPASRAILSWRHDPKVAGSLPDNRVRAVLRDTNGRLWVGTTKGLVRRDGKASGDSSFAPVQLPIASGHTTFITKLFEASDGRIWIGTHENGAFVFDPKSGNTAAVRETDTVSQPLSNEFVYSFTETTAGEIWIGTYGQGIVVVGEQGKQTRRIRHDPRTPSGLNDNGVAALLRDSSGLIWVGTEIGLGRHDPMQTAVVTILGAEDRTAGINGKDVYSIMLTGEGTAWLGLMSNGIDIIDPVIGRIKNFTPDPKAIISSMASAIDGTKYIGTERGLFHVDRSGRLLSRVTLASPTDNTLGRVGALMIHGKHLWIGGAYDGLLLLDMSRGSAAIPVRPPGIEKLTDQRAESFEPEQGDAVWIGTVNGLNLYHPATRKLETILPDEADSQSLSAGGVTSLLTDSKKRLWVGTSGGGINVLMGRDANGAPRFRRLGTKEGLPHANIAKLLQGTDGNIWASTDNGIAMIDPETFAIKSLGRADGVAVRAFWNNSGAVNSDGDLLFGGSGGLTIIRPKQYREWTYRPAVVITELRINGKAVAANRFNGLQPSRTEALTIAPDGSNIAVEFAALDYSSPEHNRYAYRLEGYDKAWIDTDPTRRLASYSNLPPGDYRLHLRGSNRNGVWSEIPLVVPIRVLPAWYQTWWMRFIEAVAALAAVFALVQGRTQYLRQRRNELQTQVSERTDELQRKQNQLVTANKELSNSAETLRQLGDIGRDITANLDAASVFNALHRHIGGLLDAAAMSIHRVNAAGTMLEPVFAREDGRAIHQLSNISIESPTSNIARVARQRRELLLERQPDIVSPSQVPNTRHMLTSLFAPLIVDERLLGVMSIQSDRPRAYGNRERLIFRTLCAYGAIALDNAGTYRQLEATLKTLNHTQSELLDKNQELARANALQEEHQSELTRFLAVASHDLRQPMHALNLYLGALTNFDMPEPARPVLGNVRQCAQILDDMFLALLDLSRLDAQVVDPFIERFPIASLLASLEVGFAPQARAKGLELRVAPSAAWVETDAALVEQIVSNLIANAIRYTESGGVLIGCRRRGEVLRVAVFDTGIGISAEQQKSVFDEFRQIGNPGHDRTKGLGLGLAIVRRLGRLLSAPVTLVSTPGKGSMFAIDLPMIDAAKDGFRDTRLHEVKQPPLRAESQHRLAGKLVVVIDDEESILGAMRVLLEQWGCMVVTAVSAKEAIAKLADSTTVPDALICDYRLGSIENGVDAIRMIQGEFNQDIPSLVVTGTISVEGIHELTSAGMPTLHKPVNSAHLHESLLKILAGVTM